MSADGALRFTLARTVDLVAVSSAPRTAGPHTLPDHVRLVDLATAGELAELADPDGSGATGRAGLAVETLDRLIARAEARLVRARADAVHDDGARRARAWEDERPAPTRPSGG